MGFIIGLLTLVMVLDCLILIFLVLIQLPKKEAGAGHPRLKKVTEMSLLSLQNR